MRKWIVTTVGIVAGVGVLAAISCGQGSDTAAPASENDQKSGAPTPTSVIDTGEPPGTSQPPVSITDKMNPEECSFVHNINACFTQGQPPADIRLDEYMGLFFMAPDDLVLRLGIEITAVKIADIENVDWPDTSPEAGVMYAQVITSGFKMTLGAEGGTYVYHTSMDRVVLVEQS